MTPELQEEKLELERRKQRLAIEEKAIAELREHMQKEDDRQERVSHWHIGKEVPAALIVAFAMQTVGIIWWAATISATQKSDKDALNTAQAVQVSVDRRQDEESKRSEERVIQQLDKLNVKVDKIIDRISSK